MGKIKRIAWWLGFLFACAVLVVSGSGQLAQFTAGHRTVGTYLFLVFLFAIPTSLVTVAVAYLIELLLVGWPQSSLRMLWGARASVKLDALSIAMMSLP